MISYEGLQKQLQQKGVTRSDLVTALGISSRTIAKIAKGEKLSPRTLGRIAEYLKCDPAALCREVSENIILQTLRDEKAGRVSGGSITSCRCG